MYSLKVPAGRKLNSKAKRTRGFSQRNGNSTKPGRKSTTVTTTTLFTHTFTVVQTYI